MKLSDIMSAMNLASYAEVSLVIFMAVFVAVAIHLMRRGHTQAWNEASMLPLDDDQVPMSRRSKEQSDGR
jgi:cbb3-type cytochrome oxidase subunit 3